MNITDITFYHFENNEHQDYYFNVTGVTKEQLRQTYREMCMVDIGDLIYSLSDDELFLQQVFPFNMSYVELNDEELKNMLKQIILNLSEENIK